MWLDVLTVRKVERRYIIGYLIQQSEEQSKIKNLLDAIKLQILYFST